MNYEARLKSGHDWEKQVKSKLESLGFIVNNYGQDLQLSYEFKKIIRFNYNPTAIFIRYLPDWVITNDQGHCFLVEAKSSVTRTINYAYELTSHDLALKLSKINIDVIVIFSEWRADFVKNIQFTKKFNNSQDLSHVQGSKAPFGLIPKSSVPSFDNFFEKILNKPIESIKIPPPPELALLSLSKFM